MGKIAELLEKQALGTITSKEEKELATLLAEAKIAKTKKADEAEAEGESEAEGEAEEAPADDKEAVEAMAKSLADAVSGKLDKVMNAIEEKKPIISTGKSSKFVFDKALGRKASVEELSEIKIALPERKRMGKQIVEVSQKTAHFVGALLNNDVQKLQLLSEGTAADGGYLVPEEFANMITEDIRDLNIMRQIGAPAMTTTTDTLHLPSLASRPHANWRAEKAAKSTSTASFDEAVLTPHSLAVIVGLSNELANDASLGVSGSIVNYIAGLMSTSLAEKEEQGFWIGTGTGQPSGVDGGVYTLRSVVAGLTDASRADALIQAYQTTPQGYRNRGSWVMNMGTLYEVGRLKDGQGRYFLTDLAGSPTQTIKGRPVYESNYLAGGTVLFGDFGFYQIVDRQGIQVRVSDEATVASTSAFEKNLTYVRVEKRVDGELLLPAAVTKVTGMGTP